MPVGSCQAGTRQRLAWHMQGAAQCCVTGAAFEHMLQQTDSTLIQTVMTSVAVFARMRSQQKGQVMDLLGARGIDQNLQGQQRHINVSQCLCCLSCLSALDSVACVGCQCYGS